MGIGEIGVAVGIVAALLAGMRWIITAEIIRSRERIVAEQARVAEKLTTVECYQGECREDRKVIHTRLDDHGNRIIVLEERVR